MSQDMHAHEREYHIGLILGRMEIRDCGYGDDCWVSTRAVGTNGYTQYRVKQGKNWSLHRFIYELLVEPIPEGLVIDHLCKNKVCINPDHLEPVTQRVNNARSNSPSAMQARQTHCKRGHEFTPDNTYVYLVRGGRRRVCRTCHLARQREMRARQSAA